MQDVLSETTDETQNDEVSLTSHLDCGSVSPGFSSPAGLVEVGDEAFSWGPDVAVVIGKGMGC